jgi:transcriptional regulator with XRE-family HTH domain
VSTDWDGAAVAKAVNERMTENGVKQKAVAKRAEISTATLRGIQRNYQTHRPTPDTLDRLSIALGFEPGHLQGLAEGPKQPARDDAPGDHQPEPGNTEPRPSPDMLALRLSKLDTIEKYLNDVAITVRRIDRNLNRIAVDIQHPVQDHPE